MPRSFLVAGARTPIGKLSGALASQSAADLGAVAIDAVLERAEVAADEVEHVVVGNKGMKGAKRFLLGSVPNKVAHNAPCSVVVVKTT